MKHFTSIAQASIEQLRHVLDVARQLKQEHKDKGGNPPMLAGRTLAMIFEKPSLRTRVSFAVAMTHLGGSSILLRQEEVGIDTREPLADVARVLSGMCDGIMARTFSHRRVLELARLATVPVINGLTDYSHPCQAMADVMTIEEHFGTLAGRTVAFIGDGNNVARSLLSACGKFGMKFVLAAPKGYEFPADDVKRMIGQIPQIQLTMTGNPAEAVRQADVIYTDTWVSMGQEQEKAQRVAQFRGFEVNEALLAKAPKHAIVLHCLPAYRGMEISAGVMEGPQSNVFPQSDNRLHFQKGLLAVLMAGK